MSKSHPEISEEDKELSRSIIDSLQRQIKEVTKLIHNERQKLASQELEIKRRNDQLKANWIIHRLKLEKVLQDSSSHLDSSREKWSSSITSMYHTIENYVDQVKKYRTDRLKKVTLVYSNLLEQDLPLGQKNMQTQSNLGMHILTCDDYQEDTTGRQPTDQEDETAKFCDGSADTPKIQKTKLFLSEKMNEVIRGKVYEDETERRQSLYERLDHVNKELKRFILQQRVKQLIEHGNLDVNKIYQIKEIMQDDSASSVRGNLNFMAINSPSLDGSLKMSLPSFTPTRVMNQANYLLQQEIANSPSIILSPFISPLPKKKRPSVINDSTTLVEKNLFRLSEESIAEEERNRMLILQSSILKETNETPRYVEQSLSSCQSLIQTSRLHNSYMETPVNLTSPKEPRVKGKRSWMKRLCGCFSS